MDVDELKLYNLKRIAKENNCDEPAKLARVLGVRTQHTSKLLRGQAGIGNKTIERFVKAFKVDASEFVAEPHSYNEKDMLVPK